MTSKITQVLSTMTTKQKAMAGVFVLITIIVLWQVVGIFGGGGSAPAPQPVTTSANTMNSAPPSANGNVPGMPQQPRPPMPGSSTPQQAQLIKQTPEMTQREQELIRAQQETQARYIATLNELTNLKMSVQVAETNAALMKAKLATIVSQKSIVDLLTKQAAPVNPGTYAQGLVNPAQAGGAVTPPQSQVSSEPEANYTVISVSQLQYKWAAVLGLSGSLYNVMAGDVLPADGSIVIAIDKSGVILEKNGARKKVSLVPII